MLQRKYDAINGEGQKINSVIFTSSPKMQGEAMTSWLKLRLRQYRTITSQRIQDEHVANLYLSMEQIQQTNLTQSGNTQQCVGNYIAICR
jgi:hypothetical protein